MKLNATFIYHFR